MRTRLVVCQWMVMLAIHCLTALAGEVKIEDFEPVKPEEAGILILPAATPGGVTELEHESWCSKTEMRTAVLALSWKVSAQSTGAQRVDITKFRDGFALNRYQTSPRLPRGQTVAGIEGAEAGINYYWRVLTETAQGWVPSGIGRFLVPVCPWDEADPDDADLPPSPGSAPEVGGPAGSRGAA